MLKMPIEQGWTVRAAGDASRVPANVRGAVVPATVPGTVHTDLLAAGLIADPYLGLNEHETAWIGESDWRYETAVDMSHDALRAEHVELVFEGLDTVATVEVNGVVVGRAEDMHVEHRFDVKPHLKAGANALAVTFASPLAYARGHEARLGNLPATGAGSNQLLPHNFIRKMSCNFGWDWGPQLVTSGIWRPAYLTAWSRARVAYVRPLATSATERRATLDVHVDLAGSANDATVQVWLLDPAGHTVARGQGVAHGPTLTVPLSVDDPQRWWPVGHGEQPLYTLDVALFAGRQQVDGWHGRVGLRTVELHHADDTLPDGRPGREWTLAVNGKRLFCKGANWIPDDCFPHRVTPARYREKLQLAVDANMNMLRVWGGGTFESHAFYDLCDELGLMVWQDFLFACAAYPEEEPFPALVEREARQNVARLARHPSLVYWNGCNENLWGYHSWNWKPRIEGRTWGARYYFDLLPAVLKELDPSRPYWPGSPFPGSLDEAPNQNDRGTRHVWEQKFPDYRAQRPRFVSEFGHQAPPVYATLLRADGPDGLARNSVLNNHRQKADANDAGNKNRIDDPASHFFDLPQNFDDWSYLAQVVQARAIRIGVEHWRALWPHCAGAIYWQHNDCWPVNSWACVDGDGRLKPLWYATRRFFADRLLTIQPAEEGRPATTSASTPASPSSDTALVLCAVNDTDDAWRHDVGLLRTSFDGTTLAGTKLALDVAPRSVARLPIPANVATPADRSRELLVAGDGTLRATWFFDVDKRLAYPAPRYETTVRHDAGATLLSVTAQTLLRDLSVFPDRLSPAAVASDCLVTLLPGERVVFRITGLGEVDEAALTRAPVLRCTNPFGSGAGIG